MNMARLLLVFLIVSLLAASARAERVRTAIPRATLNYLSVQVADVKGFFRG